MSQLIFITTNSKFYELVGLAKKKNGAIIKGRSVMFRAGNVEVIVIDELTPVDEKPHEVKLMAKIINEHVVKNKNSESFCAIHGETRMGEMAKLLVGVNHVAHLLHMPGNPLYEKVFCLLKDGVDMADKVERVCSLISKRPVVSRIASIKHRIGHILLPLDIDIQGLIESDKSGSGAFDYYKAIEGMLRASGSAYEDIEKMLMQEKSSCKNTKEISRMLKKGKGIIQEIRKISGAIDTRKASDDSLGGLKRLLSFLKKDAKNGSNMFHDWFAEIMCAVNECYGD